MTSIHIEPFSRVLARFHAPMTVAFLVTAVLPLFASRDGDLRLSDLPRYGVLGVAIVAAFAATSIAVGVAACFPGSVRADIGMAVGGPLLVVGIAAARLPLLPAADVVVLLALVVGLIGIVGVGRFLVYGGDTA